MTDWQEEDGLDREALARVVAGLDSNESLPPADVDRVRALSLHDMERHQVAGDDSLAALCLAVGFNGHQSWRLVLPEETVEVRVTTTRARRHRLGRRGGSMPVDDQVMERLASAASITGLGWLPKLGTRVLHAPDCPWLVVVDEPVQRSMAHQMLATAWNAGSQAGRTVAEATKFGDRLLAVMPTRSALDGYARWGQLDLVTYQLFDHDLSQTYLSWWACHRWSSLVVFCEPACRATALRLLGVGDEEAVEGEVLADGVELLGLDDTVGSDGAPS